MDWTDSGIVLAAKRHGESSLVVALLTREHGLYRGLVRGGAGRRARGHYEPGNEVWATWRARLPEHLGSYVCELVRARAGGVLDEPLRLAGLNSACALLQGALAERLPFAGLFEDVQTLLERIVAEEAWPAHYVAWEARLLGRLGFGLDLTACALTGDREDLAFVSPRTGRAVARAAAGPYRAKLLPLPSFLLARLKEDEATARIPARELIDGLTLTGALLKRHVFAPADRALPAARERLLERLARLDSMQCAI